MIFRHERASAVRIAVNSNTIIVMSGGAGPKPTALTGRALASRSDWTRFIPNRNAGRLIACGWGTRTELV